ncbi:MAG: endonuclease/exonuclease/phosphatase family protein [Paludibacteraceae bacterium]|nr:endonuclease/exonuclease/phosphatase family protein [Paludibacteraceae bacterium]
MKIKILAILAFLTIYIPIYSQEEFKVMTYNIRNSNAKDGDNSWDNRREATIRMIESNKPDIIGMQELCPDQEMFLDSALTVYNHIGIGREDGKHEGEIMAIFYDTTKLGMKCWGTFWLSETPDKPSKGWDAACKRTCTWAVMFDKKNGIQFLFYNTHLDHVGKKARQMEVQQIADSIKTMSERIGIGKVFMTGDFNTSAHNNIFEPLKKVLVEAREVSPLTDRGYTYNGFGKVNPDNVSHHLDSNGNSDNEVAIDHIFFKGAKATEFRVLREGYGVKYVSDHFPVIGIFQ